MKQTTFSRNFTLHNASGATKSHYNKVRDQSLSRETRVIYSKVLCVDQDYSRVQVYEALLIQMRLPVLSLQSTGFYRTLKLHNLQRVAARRTIKGHERPLNVIT